MARPETRPGVEGGGAEEGAEGSASTPPADVVRPGTGVVRPGTGVVRPGTGVVRPGSATPADPGAAKASAAVPEAPQQPREPIHVVLPVIPLKPAKQGFLDRLVAPKPKKTEAELAEEEAQREADEARKAEEARRKAEEAQRKTEEKARKAADEAERDQVEAAAKAAAKAEAKADEAQRKAEDAQRRVEEKVRKADEKARRAEEKAREKAERDEDEEFEDEPAGSPRGLAGPSAPPLGAPPRPGQPGPTAPPRPGQAPSSPPRPGARPAPARPYQQTAPPRGRPHRVFHRGADYEARPADRVRRPLWHWIVAAAAIVGLGAGTGAITGAAMPPATVQYVEGLDTGQSAPILGGLTANAPRPTINGVAATVGPLFADTGLGVRVAGSIVDGLTGDSLYDLNSTDAVTPASTAKLLTAAAVLHARGPSYRIATRVVAGSGPGEVVIIGGGDPTLAAGPDATYRGAARLDRLAEQVREALNGETPTRVLIDTSIFQGPATGPNWGAADIGGIISPITALMTNGARVIPLDTRSNAARYAQPAVAAGQLFAQALGLPPTAVTSGVAPRGTEVLGEVFSPPMARLVEIMLSDSDNVVAEALARQAALAKDMPASFAGAAAATKAVLADLGVADSQVSLADGSGLSDDNRVTAKQLTDLLVKVASPQYPQLRSIMSGLPVAGYSGTLNKRGQGSGLGVVRAKTGTLNHVNALAGFVVDRDGRLLAFAVVADATSNLARAEAALDRVASGLAACGCR